jgi:beta-lactamase regulating signal transducer with metallopeptidase domain
VTSVLLLKVTCVLALGLGAMPLLRRTSAALRHGVLIVTLAAVAAVPLLAQIAPGWGPTPIASADWSTNVDRGTVIAWIWAIGTLLQLAVLIAGLIRLTRVMERAERCDDERLNDIALEISARYHLPRPVRVLRTDCSLAPLTWGHWRPDVLLPLEATTWDDERAAAVLRHEMAHVRRHDWLTQLLATMARAIVWWHPLVWLLTNRLRRESEYACDAHVVSDGLSPHRYAMHLVELARASLREAVPMLPAPSLASRSLLESRVRRLLDARPTPVAVTNLRTRSALVMIAIVASTAVAGYGSRSRLFAQPVVIPLIPDKPITLTLLLDGRMVDLSKDVPPLPDPNAGVVNGAMFSVPPVNAVSRRTERTF